MKRVQLAAIVASLALAATAARGEPASGSAAPPTVRQPPPPRDRLMEPAWLVGVRLGPVIPQAFNKLSTNFLVDVEGAYQLPFWHRRLGLFLDVGYSQPTASGSRADARIMANNGVVTWDLTVRDLGFALGAEYRHAVGRWVVPYVGAGAKLHLTRSVVNQRVGAIDLGSNTEDSTRVGFLGRVGLGLHLGPGDLVAELHVEYTTVDHLITGDNNTAHLAFQVGYLLRL